MDNELEAFKQMNLADYAAAQGYELNKQKSSKNSLCYDHSSGDRVIIGRDATSGHGVYYSVRDDADNGTIIDFVQRRQGLNLGQARKELRPWAGIGNAPAPRFKPQPVPEPSTRDRAEQQRGLAACEIATTHKYLEGRGIEQETLEHFRGRVYTDQRGNAIFPHFDQEGISGLEIKNERFTGFSKGGEKGLWFHGPKPKDAERVVVCESAIDCMSHYQLQPSDKTLYVSTAGKMSPDAKENLQGLLNKYDQAEIVAAFDNDKDGQRFAQELADMAGRNITNGLPHDAKDWNDQLKLEQEREMDRWSGPRPRMGRDQEWEMEI